jgi:hypothetical protein
MPLEGWVPAPDPTLADVIERAFDYRGHTTVVKTDGSGIVGHVFNRVRDVPEPFLQMFGAAGEGPLTIGVAEIATIRFTGKDMAAGGSDRAWLERRAQEPSGPGPPPPVAGP